MAEATVFRTGARADLTLSRVDCAAYCAVTTSRTGGPPSCSEPMSAPFHGGVRTSASSNHSDQGCTCVRRLSGRRRGAWSDRPTNLRIVCRMSTRRTQDRVQNEHTSQLARQCRRIRSRIHGVADRRLWSITSVARISRAAAICGLNLVPQARLIGVPCRPFRPTRRG